MIKIILAVAAKKHALIIIFFSFFLIRIARLFYLFNLCSRVNIYSKICRSDRLFFIYLFIYKLQRRTLILYLYSPDFILLTYIIPDYCGYYRRSLEIGIWLN